MFNLDKYQIDKIKIKNEEFIDCKSRKKLIKVTPEEEVRQKIIRTSVGQRFLSGGLNYFLLLTLFTLFRPQVL